MQLNLAAFLRRRSSPYYLLALRANPGWLILASRLGTCMGFLQIHSGWNAVVAARCQLARPSKGNL